MIKPDPTEQLARLLETAVALIPEGEVLAEITASNNLSPTGNLGLRVVTLSTYRPKDKITTHYQILHRGGKPFLHIHGQSKPVR